MNDNLLETAARWWVSLGGAATTLLRVTIIIVAAWLLIAVLQRTIRTLRERIASRMDDRESTKRADTLGRVFRYLATVVVSLIAGMLVLAELGVSVAPILGAAGVVGLAVGFGAQSLVKDFFTGFFILLENQIRQGDVVKIGDHAGSVEVVTLRYVQLRDYDGNVHYIPNGHISTVINMTRGFSNAVMDIGVAYRENVDEVMAVMRGVAAELREDPDFLPKIIADLEVAGVESWADSAVIIRCRFRTLPLEQWSVKREYLRRLKAAFDAQGIEIPYPHVTVYAGQDRQGKAPAFPLQQLAEA
ncbi:mechanosensitive ion channel protein MscS [Hydrogenophaga sp. Root209]|uniref:mechanosensitive ion channel family protein n=1 Tax=Hydrogenophaga sp. Root209 TaxID=1736490 RepID=UPI0006F3A431|nr:mechanosensitive ion channel family protein [Hydrogenophaga sp. Root209]KRC10083.1 mechanosensitive ion channel protein MscS [Hydrogenophaga sp. Root209]